MDSSTSYLSNKSNEAISTDNSSLNTIDIAIKWNTIASEDPEKIDYLSNSKNIDSIDKFNMDIGDTEISMIKNLSIHSGLDCVSKNESEVEIKEKGIITKNNSDSYVVNDSIPHLNHRTEMELTKCRNNSFLTNKQNGTTHEKSGLAQVNKNVTVPKPFVFHTSHRTSRQNKSGSTDSVSSEKLDLPKSYCPSIQRSMTENNNKTPFRKMKKTKTLSNIENATIPLSFSELQPNLPSSKIRNSSLTTSLKRPSSASTPSSKNCSTGSLEKKERSAVDSVARKYSSLETLPISFKNCHLSSSNIKLKVTEPKEFVFHTTNIKSRRALNMSTSQSFSSGASTSLSKSTDSDSLIRKSYNLFSGKNTRNSPGTVLFGNRQSSDDHPNGGSGSVPTKTLVEIGHKLKRDLSQISKPNNDSGLPSSLLNDHSSFETKVFTDTKFKGNMGKLSAPKVKVRKPQPRRTPNKTEESVHSSESVFVFKAQPILRSAPFIPKRSTKSLTVSDESFFLHSEMRALERKSHTAEKRRETLSAFTKKKSQDVQVA